MVPLLTKNELFDLYWKKNLSLRAIGRKIGKSATSIRRWMKIYNIKCRIYPAGHIVSLETRRKISKRHGVHYIPKKHLRNLYWKDKKSTIDISKIFGVNKATIIRWMKTYKIPRRTPSEAGKLKVGEKNGFYRRKHNGNTLIFFSQRHKQLWKNVKFVRKVLKRWTTRPNKKEMFLNLLLQENFPNTFRYVGDGKFLIAGKCPDFVGISDKSKKIIELFGDYWHDINRRKLKPFQTPKGRKAIFAKHGFDTLIIWEKELSNPHKIVDKITDFLKKPPYIENKESWTKNSWIVS